MKKIIQFWVVVFLVAGIVTASPVSAKPLAERVNEAFRHVFDRNPSIVENQYWLKRVVNGDKTTFDDLVGAMAYHRSHGRTMGVEGIPLSQRVNEAFRSIFGRNPTAHENRYWLIRVLNGDKTTFESLRGAMMFHRNLGNTVGGDPTLSDDHPFNLKLVVRPLFFSIYDSRPSSAEKEWWQKRIDCEELISHHDLRMSMRYHHSHGARIGRPDICKFVLTPMPVPAENDTNGNGDDDGTLPVETF